MDPLEQIWAKVRRARQHHDTWERLLEEWTRGGAFHYEWHETPRRADTYEVRIRIDEPAPVELHLAYADEISNLRAALDHAVWHLCGDEAHERAAFPTATTEEQWQKAKRVLLRGFPERWLPVVESYQPFQYGDQHMGHPMSVLNRLNNANKHRLLVGIEIHEISIRPGWVPSRQMRTDDLMVRHRVPKPERLEDGAVILRFSLWSKDGDLHVADIAPDGAVELKVGPSFATMPSNEFLPNLEVFVGTVVSELEEAF